MAEKEEKNEEESASVVGRPGRAALAAVDKVQKASPSRQEDETLEPSPCRGWWPVTSPSFLPLTGS